MLDQRTVYTVKRQDWKPDGFNFDLAIQTCLQRGRLCYFNFDRGHMLDGKVVKELDNGIVFDSSTLGIITLSPLTLREFNAYIRPSLDPYVRQYIHDIDDVNVWYRKLAGMT